MSERGKYIWVKVPRDVYEIWYNYIPRKVRREIYKKVAEMIMEYAKKLGLGGLRGEE